MKYNEKKREMYMNRQQHRVFSSMINFSSFYYTYIFFVCLTKWNFILLFFSAVLKNYLLKLLWAVNFLFSLFNPKIKRNFLSFNKKRNNIKKLKDLKHKIQFQKVYNENERVIFMIFMIIL